MQNNSIVSETKRWLRYAKEDLIAAEAILKSSTLFPRHGCWLAQQAAEKAIKAMLIFLQIRFPKSHDLDALSNLLPDDLHLKNEFPELSTLSEWAVEARYPGEWPDATEKEAQDAVEQARTIFEAVCRKLGQFNVVMNNQS
ncbi:MAG: HEPN domain-containing protein [Calditrichaeota bacterium]|nr:HEPN domain-containing protein [Calditrichota bacterium]